MFWRWGTIRWEPRSGCAASYTAFDRFRRLSSSSVFSRNKSILSASLSRPPRASSCVLVWRRFSSKSPGQTRPNVVADVYSQSSPKSVSLSPLLILSLWVEHKCPGIYGMRRDSKAILWGCQGHPSLFLPSDNGWWAFFAFFPPFLFLSFYIQCSKQEMRTKGEDTKGRKIEEKERGRTGGRKQMRG